jgi:hypothetical protein
MDARQRLRRLKFQKYNGKCPESQDPGHFCCKKSQKRVLSDR